MFVDLEDIESFGWKEKNYKPCVQCGRRTLFRVRIRDEIHTRLASMPVLVMIPMCKKCQLQLQREQKDGDVNE